MKNQCNRMVGMVVALSGLSLAAARSPDLPPLFAFMGKLSCDLNNLASVSAVIKLLQVDSNGSERRVSEAPMSLEAGTGPSSFSLPLDHVPVQLSGPVLQVTHDCTVDGSEASVEVELGSEFAAAYSAGSLVVDSDTIQLA